MKHHATDSNINTDYIQMNNCIFIMTCDGEVGKNKCELGS